MAITYSSAMNSYLTFCNIHHLPIDPTPDTLSLYIMFQSHFISASSIDSYLSGICDQLEPFFPDMQKHQASVLIKCTLKGTCRSKTHGIECKVVLTVHDLSYAHNHATLTSPLDILLFDTQLNSGFCGLLWLGKLDSPDNQNMRDWKKVTMRHTLEWLPHAYAFWLPLHKSDSYFDGNCILCGQIQGAPDPVPIMWCYLKLCNCAFPLHPQLWLWADGSTPLRSWWMSRFWTLFPDCTLAGQSELVEWQWWASSSDTLIYPSIFAFLHFLYIVDPPLCTSTPTWPHDNCTRFIRPILLIWWTHDLQFTCIYFNS